MPRSPATIDFQGELIFLGTGTSVGVPMVGCDCPVCTSGDARNQRTRCGLALGLPEGNLLIDTPPDLRTQMLREGIGIIHAVLYTHEHADHIFGLDDLRLMQFYLNGPVPLWCEEAVEQRIRKSYDYAFKPPKNLHAGGVPQLRFERISLEQTKILGASVVPIRLQHGPNFEVLGFRFGNVAYCTDTNAIPPASMEKLRGLDTLILGALRHKPHSTHFSVGEALAVIAELKPRQAWLTHVSHDLDYEATNADLPENVALAYDGLRLKLC